MVVVLVSVSTRWRGIVLWRACGEQGILLYICLLTYKNVTKYLWGQWEDS